MFNLRAFLIVFALTGFVMLAGFGDSALAQGLCGIAFGPMAPGSGNTEFTFEFTFDGGESSTFALSDGESFAGPFVSTVTVTALPLPGWRLADIDCEGDDGILFDITDNSFTAECDTGDFSTGACTFFYERAVANIPTLSEWGLIAMAGLMGIVGFMIIRRKKVTA
jgi:hypothetical protein